MAIADELNDQQTHERVPALSLGTNNSPVTYVVEINKFEGGNTPQSGDEYVRINVTVLEAKGEGATPVGEVAEIFIVDSGKFSDAAKETAQLMRTVAPGTTDIKKAFLEAKSESQPLKGRRLGVNIKHKMKKSTGELKYFKSGDAIPERYYFSTKASKTSTTKTTETRA